MTIRPASVPTSHRPAEPSATLIGTGRGRPGTLVAAAIAGAAKAHSKRTRRRIAPRVWSKPGPKSGSRLASARASTRPMSPAPSPKGSTRPAAVVRDHRAPARGQDGGHDRVGGQRAVPPKRPALAARAVTRQVERKHRDGGTREKAKEKCRAQGRRRPRRALHRPSIVRRSRTGSRQQPDGGQIRGITTGAGELSSGNVRKAMRSTVTRAFYLTRRRAIDYARCASCFCS